MTGLEAIRSERKRQISKEGWSAEHDDRHEDRELMRAGMHYLHYGTKYQSATGWPWDATWFKPKDRRRNLIRAGALFLAERDRLHRINPDHSVNHVNHKLDIAVKELKRTETLYLDVFPDLKAALQAITDCYFIETTPEQFIKNVDDFMKEGRYALAKAEGQDG